MDDIFQDYASFDETSDSDQRDNGDYLCFKTDGNGISADKRRTKQRSSDILQMVNRAADELYGISEYVKRKPTEEKNHFVELAKEYVEEHYYENLTLVDVAKRVGISAGYLSTLFQKQLSKGFVDYLNEIRIEHACTYLKQNYLKTYEIAYKVGFHDEKYFSKVFKKIKGQSPSEYRRLIDRN